MRKIVLALLLVLPVCGFGPALPEAARAASDRQEVARIELNNAAADELVATGAVTREIAERIIDLRGQLGGFQNYDDLEELEIPKEQMEKLQWSTTIQGIATDCNC